MTSIGNIEVAGVWVGATKATSVFIGNTEVWEAETPPAPPSPLTKVKYTSASGLSDWEGDIVGELSGASINSPTSQIPNVTNSIEIQIGSHITNIG